MSLGKVQLFLSLGQLPQAHPALQGLPFILETPNDDAGYAREIRTVLSWMQ